MRLKSIKLSNIRSYVSSEIKFPEGSVLLSGDIGSGKSTILLAAEFALFGIKRGTLSGQALLRNGEKKGEVELCFEIEGKQVIIKRALKRSKRDVGQEAGYIIINNQKFDCTPVELKAKVLQLLGYPESLITKSKDLIFRYTVYTPQEEMKQILLENKDTRLNILRKVFGIDKYKKIRGNCEIYIRSLKEKKNLYKGEILDLDQKKKNKEEKQKEINKIDEKINPLLPEIEDIKKQLEEKNKELKQTEKSIKYFHELKKESEVNNAVLEQKNETIIQNKKQIENTQIQIQQLKQRIKTLAVKRPTDKKEPELEAEITKKEAQLNSVENNKKLVTEKLNHITENLFQIEQEIQDSKNKIKKIENKKQEIAEIEKDIKNKDILKKEVDEINKVVEEIKNVINRNKILIVNSENIKKKISKLDQCPTCMQSVNEAYKLNIHQKESKKVVTLTIAIENNKKLMKERASYQEELKKQLDSISEKEKLCDRLKTEIRLMEDSIEISRKKQKIIENLKKEKEKLTRELEELNKVDTAGTKQWIESVKQVLAELRNFKLEEKEKAHLADLVEEKTMDIEKIIKENTEVQKKIEELYSRKIKLGQELDNLSKIEKEYEGIRKELEQLQQKERKLEISKTSLEKEKEGVMKLVEELEKDIKTKEETKLKLTRILEIQNWLENYFIKLMHTMEKQVMIKIYYEFSELFQHWFNLIMEEETMTAKLDEEFTPIIEQNGYETDIEHLSGGERTAAALSYRLALNKVINDVQAEIKTKDLIILDEPTDGFSTEQLDKVRLVLEELSIKQVIIVSHESKVESFVDNVIRISKQEHVSGVV